jgi:16S rRNA (cytidine1402-2'-O)-methyltransferase
MPEQVRPGTLFMIPSPIAEGDPRYVLPQNLGERIRHIRHFVVETPRISRRFLSSLKIFPSMEALSFEVLDKDTKEQEVPRLMKPLQEGHDMGVLSDAGCPGVADPGAQAAAYAHSVGAPVVPIVGPSSILLALMASGLNGQRFAFHGYLPVKKDQLEKAIRELERESRLKNQTQIFIETPYRNEALFRIILGTCHTSTQVTLGIHLTARDQVIRTLTVGEWKKQTFYVPKATAVFMVLVQ